MPPKPKTPPKQPAKVSPKAKTSPKASANRTSPKATGSKAPKTTTSKNPSPKTSPKRTKLNFLEDSHRIALLPWLALGFGILPAKADGFCGMEALVDAYNNEALKWLKKSQVKQWLKSQNYRRKANAWLQQREVTGFGALEDRAIIFAEDNLHFDQLVILLEIANEENGTSFQLGSITEGYNGVVEKLSPSGQNRVFNNEKFLRPVTGMSGVMERRPVIWIRNDGAMSRAWAEGRDREDVVPHWDGLGWVKNSTDKRKFDVVNKWGLSEEVREAIEKGVWVVLKQSTSETETGLLDVMPGTFVRGAEPLENGEKSENWKYVEAFGGGEDRGYVLEENIYKIESATGPRLKSLFALQAPEADDEDELQAETEVQQGFLSIYRAVQETNILGRKIKKKYIDGFAYENGQFLAKAGETDEYGFAWVRRIVGQKGRARKRCLQLLENPWGLPDKVPIENPFSVDDLRRVKELKNEARKRGLEFDKGAGKEELIEAIKEDEKNNYELRLYHLNEVPPIKPPKKEGDIPYKFMDGQILYMTKRYSKKEDKQEFRDFEGAKGWIDGKYLTPKYLDRCPKPFGLRIKNDIKLKEPPLHYDWEGENKKSKKAGEDGDAQDALDDNEKEKESDKEKDLEEDDGDEPAVNNNNNNKARKSKRKRVEGDENELVVDNNKKENGSRKRKKSKEDDDDQPAVGKNKKAKKA